MDLARTYMLAEMGLLKRFLKLKWMPIVNAAEFTYIRDIKPLKKFEIETKVVGWDEKYFYIVTELCTGGELFDHIIDETRLTEREAAEILKQIFSAIFYCHSKKIVHR